jgi:hypothetical protein
LRRERDNATNRLTALSDEINELKSGRNSDELLKLRSLVGHLRNELAAATNSPPSGSTQSPSAPPHSALTPRQPRKIDEFQNVGVATPEATAETLLWAALHAAFMRPGGTQDARTLSPDPRRLWLGANPEEMTATARSAA